MLYANLESKLSGFHPGSTEEKADHFIKSLSAIIRTTMQRLRDDAVPATAIIPSLLKELRDLNNQSGHRLLFLQLNNLYLMRWRNYKQQIKTKYSLLITFLRYCYCLSFTE